MAGTAAPEQLKDGTDGMPLYSPLVQINLGPDSGWRAFDEERTNELKEKFKAGDWNQTRLPCVTATRQAGASEAMAWTAAPEQLKGGTDGMPLYMPLEDISFGPDSGWRTADEERKNELKVEFKAGNWNQTTLPCIAFQAKTDADGKWLIDDGLSSGTALLELSTEYAQEKARHDEIVKIRKTPVQEVTDEMKKKLEALAQDTNDAFPDNWPMNLINIFINGLKDHTFNKYADDSPHARRLWNASQHDSVENNPYRQTTLVDSIRSADDAVKEMTNVLGKGQNSMIKRWVRCAKAFCGPENNALMDLEGMQQQGGYSSSSSTQYNGK